MRFLQETIDTTTMLTGHPSVLRFDLVGSHYLETANDLDFLVLVKGDTFSGPDDEDIPATDAGLAPRWMFGTDWSLCGGEYDDQTDQWGAIRNGDVNLIVTVDEAWYDRMLMASNVCKALQLADKGDRIVVHRVIRDGYTPEDANARRDGSR